MFYIYFLRWNEEVFLRLQGDRLEEREHIWPLESETDPAHWRGIPRGDERGPVHTVSLPSQLHPARSWSVAIRRIYKPVIVIKTFSNAIFFLPVLSTRDLWFTVNSLCTDNVWSAGEKASDVSAVGEATTGVARRLDFSPMTSGSSAADADKTTSGVSICTLQYTEPNFHFDAFIAWADIAKIRIRTKNCLVFLYDLR